MHTFWNDSFDIVRYFDKPIHIKSAWIGSKRTTLTNRLIIHIFNGAYLNISSYVGFFICYSKMDPCCKIQIALPNAQIELSASRAHQLDSLRNVYQVCPQLVRQYPIPLATKLLHLKAWHEQKAMR